MCFNLVFVLCGIKCMLEFMFLTSKQQVGNTAVLMNKTPHNSYISVRQFSMQKQLLRWFRDPVLGDLSWHFRAISSTSYEHTSILVLYSISAWTP